MCIFCRSLFVLLSFFFWPLCCLSFFDLRILIASLISSNSSHNNAVRTVICDDRIISLRGQVWSHKTSSTPPLFMEAAVPCQESDQSYIQVLTTSGTYSWPFVKQIFQNGQSCHKCFSYVSKLAILTFPVKVSEVDSVVVPSRPLLCFF
jgi:hypothetical protein